MVAPVAEASSPPGGGATVERFSGLDGCRALAALAVVVFHVTGAVGRTVDRRVLGLDLDGWMVPLGNYGVCVFFVLSGFLLHRPFVAAQLTGRRPPELTGYFRRRFLRIYPAYWLVLLAALVLSASSGSKRPEGMGSVLAHVALVQRFLGGPLNEGLGVAWTLCIEVSFYAALPAIAWCLTRLPGGRDVSVRTRAASHVYGLGLLLLVSWAFKLVVRGPSDPFPFGAHLWLPNYLDWFVLGMLLATAHAWRAAGGNVPRVLRHLADRPLLSWALAVELYWVGVLLHVPVSLQIRPLLGQELGRFAVNGFSAALFLLPVVLGTRRTASLRVLDTPLLASAGAISYGIYLWHVPLMNQLVEAGMVRSFLPLFAATTAATVVLAWFTHVLVERPAMRWRAAAVPGRRARARLVAT